MPIIIGSQGALVSQLQWQIRHEWTRQRSLEEWHKRHPDLTDDLFAKLYTLAERCIRFTKACNDPFCDRDKKLGDIWREC